MKNITIIGGGSWGTALSLAMARGGNHVVIWARNKAVVEAINKNHQNTAYLPDISLPSDIRATSDLAQAAKGDILLLTIPAQTLRDNCQALRDAGIAPHVPLVLCCKGIEQGTQKLMSEVVADVLPNPVAILSGPNFAREVALGLPTATTLACADEALGIQLAQALASKYFRPYFTPDIMGAQVGGAVKNVLAIACGIAMGKGLGENARASLVTRGIAEIGRLCKAKGGQYETLLGLSGIGDIMLTCGSLTSRNMAFGYALGQGKQKQEALAEGVATSQSVTALAQSLGVDMPIAAAVHAIIFEGAEIGVVVNGLLERPLRGEN